MRFCDHLRRTRPSSGRLGCVVVCRTGRMHSVVPVCPPEPASLDPGPSRGNIRSLECGNETDTEGTFKGAG